MSRRDKVWNFTACLCDAVGWPLGMAFFSAMTLVPVLLRHLGADNFAIGCLPALYNLLMFLPGFLVAGHISRLRRARGYLFGMAMAERFALLPLIGLTLAWGRTHPSRLLTALFVCISLHAAATGLNQPAYWVVVGKCIPASWRGRLFGYAGGVAGLLGLGVDRLMRHLLSGPDGGFPVGYSQAFLVGFVVLMVSVLPLGIVREPPGLPAAGDDPHTGHYGRDSLRVWRTHAGFRRFLYGQVAFTLAALAAPFYVLAAAQRFHVGSQAVAGYTATLVLVTAFGGLGWGAWSDRAGNKPVLIAASACAAFAAVFASLAPSATAFYGVFAGSALASAGIAIAGFNIVMEYAGEARDIPLYTAMYNAVTAFPRALGPLLGGLLADKWGYAPVFVLAAALALISLLLTLRAGEPRQTIAWQPADA